MASGRKILYFLGAGASYGAGAYATVQAGGHLAIPMQSSFWDTFLRLAIGRENRRIIEAFLFRYFLGYRKVPARLKPAERRRLLSPIDVEEVFTFLSERVAAPSTSDQLRKHARRVWNALVSEVGPVFRRFNASTSTRSIYRDLVKNHIRAHDAIVSFNYDLVFEKSLPKSRPWIYEAVNKGKNALRILKPHGSLNWEVVNDSIHVRPNPRSSLIVAPTHLKFLQTHATSAEQEDLVGYANQSQQIDAIWSCMERHMREAKALVFIGYSFPAADLFFSSVLRAVLADRAGAPAIVLVNPDAAALAKRVQIRFSVKRVFNYFTMQQFVQATRSQVLAQCE